MNLKSAFFAVTIAAIAAPAFAQQEKDTIRLKKETKPKDVSISEETFKGVVCTVGSGGKTTYLWKEIESIDYQGRPKDLSQAIGQVKKADYEDALTLLKKFRDDQKLRPIFRQQALFYFAQASESKTPPELDNAIATYRDLLKEFKQSRFLNKANDGIVRCLVAAKKFDEARKALNESRQEAIANKLDDELLRDFDLLEASLFENENKFAEAANTYDKLAAAAGSNVELADLARIGSARCQMKKGGDVSRSRVVYKDIINKSNKSTSPMVLAAAWNGMGEIQLSEGKKEKKAEKVQEALYSFLRGIVLFFPGENDRTTEIERSLFYSADAFWTLADLTTDETQKKVQKARGDDNSRELNGKYPLSPFARKK